MLEHLKNYHVILASNSPRRRELLGGLGIPFEVKVLPDVSETYPDTLAADDTAQYIAVEKAAAYADYMQPGDLVITADTVVVCQGEVLGKPVSEADACRMLRCLSGRTHHVVTGVCLTTLDRQRAFSVSTEVTFKKLSNEEINYYVTRFHPMDKAGAYGIQEWIGYIGVTGLSGSYFNVMGLPVQRIYEELSRF